MFTGSFHVASNKQQDLPGNKYFFFFLKLFSGHFAFFHRAESQAENMGQEKEDDMQ